MITEIPIEEIRATLKKARDEPTLETKSDTIEERVSLGSSSSLTIVHEEPMPDRESSGVLISLCIHDADMPDDVELRMREDNVNEFTYLPENIEPTANDPTVLSDVDGLETLATELIRLVDETYNPEEDLSVEFIGANGYEPNEDEDPTYKDAILMYLFEIGWIMPVDPHPKWVSGGERWPQPNS